MINVILADHQRIFHIGMASTLATEDDIRIVGQPHTLDQLLNSLEQFRAHVLVLSSAFLGKLQEIKRRAARQETAILLLEERDNVVLSQFSSEVSGILQRTADPSTAVQCIRHVARGGKVLRFVRNHPAHSLQDSVGLRVRQRLSRVELRIVALVVQGFTNREIATSVGSTEQGVKNSLRRIFDKTGVSDRLELALFMLHHRIVVRNAEGTHLAKASDTHAASHSWLESHRHQLRSVS
jgi:DNA-binding NarL/FixJ family response regulator